MTSDLERVSRWLDYRGLATYLGVDEEDLRAWVVNGRIPSDKIPGSELIRFDRVEIDQWMRSGVGIEHRSLGRF